MAGNLADQTLTLNKLVSLDLGGFPQAYVNWLTFTNHSPFALQLNQGGNLYQIPAWYYYPVKIAGSVAQQISVLPYLQTIPGSSFTATLSTNLYFEGEDPPSTVPTPLGGGPVDLTIATQVVNKGNPALTSIVFGAPLSDPGAVQINNDGTATFGDTAYPGSVTISGGNQKVVISNSQIQIFDILGNLLIQLDQNGKLSLGNANADGQFSLTMSGITLNGSTSGTAKLYQWMRGTCKITWIDLNNFRNGNAGVQNIALPVAYTGRSLFRTGNTSPLNALSSGVAQSFGIITGLAAAGGSVTVQTQLNKFSIADQINAFDTISFLGSQASAFTGLVIIEGT